MSLLDKASLVQIPSGYKATKLYSVVPDSGAGDFTFTRSSTGSRVGSDGLIETGIAIDTPRLDYSGGATCPTLLLEPQRTNQQTYSEDLTNGAWITSNVSVDPNQTTSPDGTTTADKVDYGSGNGFIRNAVTLGSATTFSIFVKYFDFQWIQIMASGNVTHYANFDVQNGVLGNVGSGTEAEIEDYGNGWYRIVAKFVSGTFGGQPRLYKISSGVRPWAGGDGAAGSYYMWGGQQEVGTYQTSYIPTTSSTVTRTSGRFLKDGLGSIIGQTEGCIFLDFIYTEGNRFYIYDSVIVSDGFLLSRSGTTYNLQVGNGASSYVLSNVVTGLTIGTRYKLAINYALNDYKSYVNGSQTSTNTSITVPTTDKLESSGFGGSNIFTNKIKQFILFDEKLTDTELAALTTI